MQPLRSSHSGSAFGAATRLAQHCAIGRFVAQHPELGLRIVRCADQRTTWQALDERRQLRLPSAFEPEATRQLALAQHQQMLLDEAFEQGQLTWRERNGFRDFAFLLSHEQSERLFLVGLECATALLSYKALEQAFTLYVAGSSAQSQSSLFADFVSVALSRPVLTQALLKDLHAFCELLRDFVQQAPRPDSVPPPTSTRQPAGGVEAGIVAVAIAPSDAVRAGRDPLRALVEARRLLHEMQGFAAEHPGARALPLEDYGALLTLPPRAGVKAQPKAETARKLAERLRQLAHTRLQLTTVAGTALAQHAPESREAVGQRAILALRMALENGQAVLLLDDLGAASKAVRHSHVLQALERLCSTFERQAMSEAGAMAHAFIQAVTCFAGGRLDLVRLQYVLAITQVAKATQRRHCLAADMPETWGDEAALKLDACSSLEELTCELKRTLNRLALVTTNHDGPSYLRIDELLDYLRQNLAEPVKLPQLARRTGFSVPSFCRVFKRATGHSLLSYVRGLRIDRAKHLLATTELPNNSVAELSGFHSQHHFIRSFKKVTRSTPGEYRRALNQSEELRA